MLQINTNQVNERQITDRSIETSKTEMQGEKLIRWSRPSKNWKQLQKV